MDLFSSLECLKLDSQSEVPHKDGDGKDLLSPDTVPLNCNTRIIGSKAEEQKAAKQCLEKPSPPPNDIFGECLYCLKVGDHISHYCPYKSNVPKNAIVGSGCVVNCKICGRLFRGSRCARCGSCQGHAILKSCSVCETKGEHMSYECPNREKKYYPFVVFKCDPYTGDFSFEYAPLKE
ncbi:unnamed protein product [Prunus armeniaca]